MDTAEINNVLTNNSSFIMNCIRKKCRCKFDEDTMNDIAQEVMIKFYETNQNGCGFNKNRGISVRTYLYKVVNSVIIDHSRNNHRTDAGNVYYNTDFINSIEIINNTDFDYDIEIIKKIYFCIDALKPIDRAIVLQIVEGNKYQNVADNLGLNINYIKGNFRRSIHKLRKMMGADINAPVRFNKRTQDLIDKEKLLENKLKLGFYKARMKRKLLRTLN